MNLEYGKRYVRRDGGVTAPLVPALGMTRYSFVDTVSQFDYPEDGRWWVFSAQESKLDLVSEFIEDPVGQDSRHTLDMCDALNTRIDQYDSTPEAKRLVLLAEMLEYCLAIHETATVDATKEQAKETGVHIAETLSRIARDKRDLLIN